MLQWTRPISEEKTPSARMSMLNLMWAYFQTHGKTNVESYRKKILEICEN